MINRSPQATGGLASMADRERGAAPAERVELLSQRMCSENLNGRAARHRGEKTQHPSERNSIWKTPTYIPGTGVSTMH